MNPLPSDPGVDGWVLDNDDTTILTIMNTQGVDRFHRELIPPTPAVALAALASPARSWAGRRFARPTAVQRLAWPVITSGRNCLVVAPTGHGKTLAAFLPIIGKLVGSGHGPLRCLYVAPLKALCNDVYSTLDHLLAEIGQDERLECARLQVGLRTGDSSAADRRAHYADPPDLLLTTPESLAVMLTQHTACAMLTSVRVVIVDEVHALAGCRRGADLSLSLERLQHLCSAPLQRIGLSATCAPVEVAAAFLVGADQSCTICSASGESSPDIAIEPLGLFGDGHAENPQRFFTRLLNRLEGELASAATTLVFTNTRRQAERLSWALRRRFPAWAEKIAVHHGSLAALRRLEVESQLKHGALRAVVCSSSLELGIDIGSVENVVLIDPPGGVTRLWQRLGRSGHRPGSPRRALILTGQAAHLLEAAATGTSGRSAQLESLVVPSHPLDVLCQHLLGMASTQPWPPDMAFQVVRRAHPYRDLPRSDFDACLDYLSARNRNIRPTLAPRLCWTDGCFEVTNSRAVRTLQRSIGTILGQESVTVRLRDGTDLGEVEPSFVDQLLPGDRFLLDGRCLQFQRLDQRHVLAEEVMGNPLLPRWSGKGWPLSRELAARLYLLRGRAGEALLRGPAALRALFREEYELSPLTVEILAENFERQEQVSEIPDTATCLIEGVRSYPAHNYFVHTTLNVPGNDALARVLCRRLVQMGVRASVTAVADLGFALTLDESCELDAITWRKLLRSDGFITELRSAVDESQLLQLQFEHVATIGLLIPRNSRQQNWSNRPTGLTDRSLCKYLQTHAPDFVLLRQARRDIAESILDGKAALEYLQDMPRRDLRVRWLPCISPFAEHWTQMHSGERELQDDRGTALTRLHRALTQESQAG